MNLKLKFTPYAWAKLVCLRDAGPTEVGGMAVCADPARPLLITDFCIVKQQCTAAYTELDDVAVDNFFNDCLDRDLKHGQFDRIWIHTHPSGVTKPSGTDEATFSKVFGRKNWAIMFILAKSGESYARLRINTDLGEVSFELTTEVDYTVPFQAGTPEVWKEEYKKLVTPQTFSTSTTTVLPGLRQGGWGDDYTGFYDNDEANWWSRRERTRSERRRAYGAGQYSVPPPAQVCGFDITPDMINEIRYRMQNKLFTNQEIHMLVLNRLLPAHNEGGGIVTNTTTSLYNLLIDIDREARENPPQVVPAAGDGPEVVGDVTPPALPAVPGNQVLVAASGTTPTNLNEEAARWRAAGVIVE